MDHGSKNPRLEGNNEWGLPAIIRLSRLPIDGTPFGRIVVVPAAQAGAAAAVAAAG